MPTRKRSYYSLRDRYWRLENNAHSNELKTLLDNYLHGASGDDSDELYTHLIAKFGELRASTLGGGVGDEDHAVRAPGELKARTLGGGQQSRSNLMRISARWGALKDDILLVAECLWIGSLINLRLDLNKKQQGAKDTEISTLRSHQLMIVWLEASLFGIRADNNREARELQLPSSSHDSPTRLAIRRLFEGKGSTRNASNDVLHSVRGYVQTIKDWDKILKVFTRQTPFKDGKSIVQQLKGMIHEFGPNSLNVINDEGWAAQAADAAAELRFQLREAIRRERWHAKNVPLALWSEILKLTTGYGTRLSNFVRTAMIFVVALTAAYFVNDLLNPGIPAVANGALFCPEARASVTWQNWFPLVIKYLYLAVTNLTSLGADARLATYCGGLSTQILVVISVGMGYFLLTLLASLLFNRLEESD